MAQRNWASGGKLYSMHVKPIEVECSFTVQAADSAGLGITNLVGACVQNVFMHTSATPGAGNKNPATPNVTVTNPNPASGTILVQFADGYSGFYAMSYTIQSPNGTPVAITAASTNLTVGVAYAISTLGDATAADWLAVGVPAGVTPAIGVSFIAKATGSGTGTTARVAPTAAAGSGIFQLEIVGNPNTALNPSPTANQGWGGQVIIQCRNDNASDASAIAAPANGSVITVKFLLSDSSIQINGS